MWYKIRNSKGDEVEVLNIEYKENLDEEFYKIIDDEFNKFAEKIRLFAIIHLFIYC